MVTDLLTLEVLIAQLDREATTLAEHVLQEAIEVHHLVLLEHQEVIL